MLLRVQDLPLHMVRTMVHAAQGVHDQLPSTTFVIGKDTFHILQDIHARLLLLNVVSTPKEHGATGILQPTPFTSTTEWLARKPGHVKIRAWDRRTTIVSGHEIIEEQNMRIVRQNLLLDLRVIVAAEYVLKVHMETFQCHQRRLHATAVTRHSQRPL